VVSALSVREDGTSSARGASLKYYYFLLVRTLTCLNAKQFERACLTTGASECTLSSDISCVERHLLFRSLFFQSSWL
jgi:hypothetical protein